MRLGLGLGISLESGVVGGGSQPLRMVRIAGQSNATAAHTLVLSPTPSTRHKRFTPGVRCENTGLTPLIGLYEQTDSFGNGGGGETLATGFTETHDLLTSESTLWLVSSHSQSGYGIANIDKTGGSTDAWTYGQAQTQAAVDAGVLVVEGIAFVHGETDAQAGSTSYYSLTAQYQIDEDTDTKLKTGQTSEVVFYSTQSAAYPPGSSAATGSDKSGSSQLMIHKLCLDFPTKFIHATVGHIGRWIVDGLHFTAGFQRVVGAYVAKAVKKRRAGADTLPLYPTSAVRSGASVVVTFNVPVSPLTWRLDLFLNTTTGNAGQVLGFGFYDDSGTPRTVTDVQITAANQVTVTLSGIPTGTQGSQEIRIGHSTSLTSGTGGSPLADSDTTVDPRGWPLPNFCCMSYVPVTV